MHVLTCSQVLKDSRRPSAAAPGLDFLRKWSTDFANPEDTTRDRWTLWGISQNDRYPKRLVYPFPICKVIKLCFVYVYIYIYTYR